MMLLYQDGPIFVYGFNHQLGSVERDLHQLQSEKLLAGSVDALTSLGYGHNFGTDSNESLLSLALGPVSQTLRGVGGARAIVFQHCYAESAVLHYDADETDIGSRNRYFPAELMRHLSLDHIPYFCSFASGCSGFMALLGAAAGFFSSSSDQSPVICVMADCMPPGVPYDMAEERILGSDQSSAFAVGREQRGYQLLGLNYYSTTRLKVPFLEIVQRTVRMIQGLATGLGLNLAENNAAIHYPNIFPETWAMVTRYLRNPRIEHVLDGIFERAHCGATDSVISLTKLHRGERGRIHIIVNYGIGLHLGVCVLKETDDSGPVLTHSVLN
jgi:hypothetical protein